jgi:hypothetical protein
MSIFKRQILKMSIVVRLTGLAGTTKPASRRTSNPGTLVIISKENIQNLIINLRRYQL